MAATLDDVLAAVRDVRRDLAAVEQHVSEVRDRSRRTETRLTRYLESIGFGTKVTKPWYDTTMHTVQVPSPECPLKDIVEAMPTADAHHRVVVKVGNEVIGYFTTA